MRVITQSKWQSEHRAWAHVLQQPGTTRLALGSQKGVRSRSKPKAMWPETLARRPRASRQKRLRCSISKRGALQQHAHMENLLLQGHQCIPWNTSGISPTCFCRMHTANNTMSMSRSTCQAPAKGAVYIACRRQGRLKRRNPPADQVALLRGPLHPD